MIPGPLALGYRNLALSFMPERPAGPRLELDRGANEECE